MKLYLLELSLGTALALASFASGPDEVRYAPEKGLKVTRTYETSSEFELESESVTVDGEERPVPGKPSGSLSSEEKFVVSDELVAVGSGRPEKLARTMGSPRPHKEFTLRDGRHVDVTVDGEYLRDRQILQFTLTYRHAGQVLARKDVRMRCFFPEELLALCRLGGFEAVERLGNYDGRPFESGSPKQILVCRALDISGATGAGLGMSAPVPAETRPGIT